MNFWPFLSNVWFVTRSKRPLQSSVLIKMNLCLSCPKNLVKTTIPLGQCRHFNQVGASEKSCFLVVQRSCRIGYLFHCLFLISRCCYFYENICWGSFLRTLFLKIQHGLFDLDASLPNQDFLEDFPISPNSLFLPMSSSFSFFSSSLVEPSFFGSCIGDSSFDWTVTPKTIKKHIDAFSSPFGPNPKGKSSKTLHFYSYKIPTMRSYNLNYIKEKNRIKNF